MAQTSAMRHVAVGLLIALLFSSAWMLSAAADPPPADPTLKGCVWYDVDGDGLMDADEPGSANVLLVLSDALGEIVAWQRSDAQGGYRLSAPAPGLYYLTKATPPGLTPTTPTFAKIDLGLTEQTLDLGHGFLLPGCYSAVRGMVWHDLDGDGAHQETDQAVEQVTVRLYTWDGDLAGVTLTDDEGRYTLDVLRGGPSYLVVEPSHALPASSTPRYWAIDLSVCSTAQADVGLYDPQAVPSAAVAAIRQRSSLPPDIPDEPATLTGVVQVFRPETPAGDGPAIGGVRMTLTDATGQVVAEQVSDANGAFAFADLALQTYFLHQAPIQGFTSQSAYLWGIAPTSGAHMHVALSQELTPQGASHALYLPDLARQRGP